MRVLWGLGVLALVLLVTAAAPAARSAECGPEFLRIDEAPEWSPGGDAILFLRRRIFDCASGSDAILSLEVVRPDGSDQRTVLAGADPVAFASWSPDGSEIAIITIPRRPGGMLRVIDAHDGRERLRVQVPFCCTARPAWSPDGTRIAIGTTIIDAMSGGMLVSSVPTTGFTSWSPDSRRIAYLGPEGLEVASADGLGASVDRARRHLGRHRALVS
jgi:dipeptidyl aminopeptidase/acylaminoacyl peptidase